MSAASSPNVVGEKLGLINRIAGLQAVAENKRRALKGYSPSLYIATKISLVAMLVAGIALA